MIFNKNQHLPFSSRDMIRILHKSNQIIIMLYFYQRALTLNNVGSKLNIKYKQYYIF